METVSYVVMECCEDTLREITTKICGSGELDAVRVEFGNSSLSVIQTNNNVDTEIDNWISSDERIPWTQSKIASYSHSQKLFRCDECECVGFLSRVAEHWLGTHANLRVFQCSQCSYTSAWARCIKMHLAQQHNIIADQNLNEVGGLWKENPVLEEVTTFLQRLKIKVDSEYDSTQQNTNNTALKNEMNDLASPETPVSSTSVNSNNVPKRYNCKFCPYATDRKDLFSRHENIHREEKPFHCYVCLKQFSRADHVKKHFVRIHREIVYDINRIRKVKKGSNNVVNNQLSPKSSSPDIEKSKSNCAGCCQRSFGSEKQFKSKTGDKKYKCSFCSWTTMDNWCLKRHLNTHIKPYSCSLCDYKAARSERLTTHIFKVHNTKLCDNCSLVDSNDSQFSFQSEDK